MKAKHKFIAVIFAIIMLFSATAIPVMAATEAPVSTEKAPVIGIIIPVEQEIMGDISVQAGKSAKATVPGVCVLKWTTSSKAVCTVSSAYNCKKGTTITVKGLRPGKAMVTGTCGGKTYRFCVTVEGDNPVPFPIIKKNLSNKMLEKKFIIKIRP